LEAHRKNKRTNDEILREHPDGNLMSGIVNEGEGALVLKDARPSGGMSDVKKPSWGWVRAREKGVGEINWRATGHNWQAFYTSTASPPGDDPVRTNIP
jgi:hypothetical protein